MKNFTLISYQFGKCGYKEDDWQIIRNINSPEDYYESLKEGYLKDALNRNNYPINSFPISRIYTEIKIDESEDNLGYLEEEEYEEIYDYRYEDDDNELQEILKDDIDIKKIELKFEKWKLKLKTLIPYLRKKKEEKELEKREKKKLLELIKKYPEELEKITKQIKG